MLIWSWMQLYILIQWVSWNWLCKMTTFVAKMVEKLCYRNLLSSDILWGKPNWLSIGRKFGRSSAEPRVRSITILKLVHQFEIFDWPMKLNSIYKCWPKDQTFFQLYFFPSGKSRLLLCVYIACLSIFSALKLQFLGKNDHFLTCYVFVFEIQ